MVHLLTSFLAAAHPDTGVLNKVNVNTEIFFYKRMKNKVPIIAFDFVACFSLLVGEEWELVCGGRHTLALHRAETIFKQLIDKGAKLAFFLEGPRKPEKFAEGIRRNNENYNKSKRMHKLLKDGLKYTEKFDINIMPSYYENFYQMAKKYGEIHISFENECDADLAAYATENNALAVFADDTDFLIMKGDWNVWSPQNFNIEKFTTTGWNKKNVRKLLNLKEEHMPIFATLCGNVYIPSFMLQHFHILYRNITGFYHMGLAEYIRENFPVEMPLKEEDTDAIALSIFLNNKGITLQEVKDLVKTSLDFYNYDKRKKNDIEEKWLKQHILETSSTFVYTIVKSNPTRLFNSLIDLSNKDITPYTEFMLPLIRRLIGVVLYEKKEENCDRLVLLKPSHENSVELQACNPIFPDFTIPLISVLLTDEKIGEYKKIEILIWIVNKKLTHSKVTAISGTSCLIPCLALYFLVQGKHITIDEADICLLSSFQENKFIRAPSVIYARPHYLAFLLSTVEYYIKSALLVSGLYKYVHTSNFDSYLLHNLHTNYNLLNPDKKKYLLSTIRKYRIYADN